VSKTAFGGREEVAAERKVLKFCRLLGDSTRLKIYEIVKSRPMGTTVREVAAEVGLHPNVARLHLAKLEKEALVTSRSLPSRSKGRPQRLYLPGAAVVEISVPRRNYSLLSMMLLEMVDGDIDALDKVHRIGVEIGKRAARKSGQSPDGVGAAIVASLEDLGFEPTLLGKHDDCFEIQTGNCIFKELVSINPGVVCRFHHAISEGIASELGLSHAEVSLGNYRCRQVIRMPGA